jgi:hypothetical protein
MIHVFHVLTGKVAVSPMPSACLGFFHLALGVHRANHAKR